MMFEPVDFWEQSPDQIIKQKKNKDKPLFDTEVIKIKGYEVKGFARIKKIQEIEALPEKNEHIRVVTHNSFNAFDILEYFVMKFKTFDECYISSYNFGEKTIKSIFDMKDKGIFENISLIISESIRFRMPKIFELLKDGVLKRKDKGVRMAGIWNHSKIILLKTKNNFFVIEGSGNFNSNAYIEQYSLDNNEDIYNFHKGWIENYVFDKDNIEKKRHFVI